MEHLGGRRGPAGRCQAPGSVVAVDVDRVLLAAPRGFCAGVEMAIKALSWMVRAFPPPVYCYHEIVHNQQVVDRFQASGVIFVDDIAVVPPGSPLMLSAHGSAPEVVAAARANGGYVVDAVCPLVTKVHHEVKKRAGQGYRILYVGHEGHEEAVGTMAVAPDAIDLVESPHDVARLAAGRPAGGVARPDDAVPPRLGGRGSTAARERFPQLWQPGRSDLCFATTNRQAALVEIAPQLRCHGGDRLGQLLQHQRPGPAGRRGRVPAGVPDQPRRGAARRSRAGWSA